MLCSGVKGEGRDIYKIDNVLREGGVLCSLIIKRRKLGDNTAVL